MRIPAHKTQPVSIRNPLNTIPTFETNHRVFCKFPVSKKTLKQRNLRTDSSSSKEDWKSSLLGLLFNDVENPKECTLEKTPVNTMALQKQTGNYYLHGGEKITTGTRKKNSYKTPGLIQKVFDFSYAKTEKN